LYLNTFCHSIYNNLIETNNKNENEWKNLCELWASDLRTHITEKRWNTIVNKISIPHPNIDNLNQTNDSSNFLIVKSPCGLTWEFINDQIKLKLNIRRGLTIESLSFKSHDFKPIIGKISQGYFPTIEYGADFYSGGVIMDLPMERKKITDFEKTTPIFKEYDEYLLISCIINNDRLSLKKSYKIYYFKEKVSISYEFLNEERPIGVIRLGNFTFLENVTKNIISLNAFNGGNEQEKFHVNMECEHGASVSSLVSSTTSIGGSGNEIVIDMGNDKIFFNWNPEFCAAIPMFKYKKLGQKILSRLSFSVCELDDTSKMGGKLMPFQINISSRK
jgi:hypothetical protein